MELIAADARAPWVEFELIAEEDRTRTEETGVYTSKDVEYVIVTPAGSKDRFESVAGEWFKRKEKDVAEGRLDPNWLAAWKAKYKAWKEGRELPLAGTPIINWPPISPAQRQMLIQWKVMTVEALAEANEEVIMRLGMGGRQLKDLATNWLRTANDVGKVALQVQSLTLAVERLEKRNNELESENLQLKAMVRDGTPAATPAQTSTESEANLGFLDGEGSFVSDTPQELAAVVRSAAVGGFQRL